MKKTLLLIILITFCISGKLFAQNVNSDTTFLKANLHLFSATATFDEIYSSDNQKAESKESLPILKLNIDNATKYYSILKTKYQNSGDFKTFEQNLKCLQKCFDMINANDPTWTLAYTLIKMNLKDFVNTKLK